MAMVLLRRDLDGWIWTERGKEIVFWTGIRARAKTESGDDYSVW